jgi:hypothetical protein
MYSVRVLCYPCGMTEYKHEQEKVSDTLHAALRSDELLAEAMTLRRNILGGRERSSNEPNDFDDLLALIPQIWTARSPAPSKSDGLEWEVTHKKSKVHKGRGSTPEAALRDLRDGFSLGVQSAQEEIEREQKRLDKLTELLGDTDA